MNASIFSISPINRHFRKPIFSKHESTKSLKKIWQSLWEVGANLKCWKNCQIFSACLLDFLVLTNAKTIPERSQNNPTSSACWGFYSSCFHRWLIISPLLRFLLDCLLGTPSSHSLSVASSQHLTWKHGK